MRAISRRQKENRAKTNKENDEKLEISENVKSDKTQEQKDKDN